jgi:hypothetical protein
MTSIYEPDKIAEMHLNTRHFTPSRQWQQIRLPHTKQLPRTNKRHQAVQ